MLSNNSRIREKCKREGYTNASLAQLLGVSEATVKHRWRDGSWSVHESAIMAFVIGIPIRWFYEELENMSIEELRGKG